MDSIGSVIQRAIGAVKHGLLVTVYFMLRHNKPYKDLGADYFDAGPLEKDAQEPTACSGAHASGLAVLAHR